MEFSLEISYSYIKLLLETNLSTYIILLSSGNLILGYVVYSFTFVLLDLLTALNTRHKATKTTASIDLKLNIPI